VSELNAKKNFINVLCSHSAHEPYFYFIYKTVSACDMPGKTSSNPFPCKKENLHSQQYTVKYIYVQYERLLHQIKKELGAPQTWLLEDRTTYRI
jgi:hypothetical protein